ncbi:Lactation elevated protein 1 [Hordeum vulgare]|nr:Lactation elevated protein 1 [Hordeum vulgare]
MDDDGPRNKNKPDGNKKAKDKIKSASSLQDKIDAMMQSNKLMVAKILKAKKELADNKVQEKQETWQLLKEEGLCKASIEERRALAEENKALAKILQEENKIMTMNRNDMDDINKEWHDIARRGALERMKQATTGDCFGVGGGE